MCKCTPAIRTPFCGKGDCQWPDKKKDIEYDEKGFLLGTMFGILWSERLVIAQRTGISLKIVEGTIMELVRKE